MNPFLDLRQIVVNKVLINCADVHACILTADEEHAGTIGCCCATGGNLAWGESVQQVSDSVTSDREGEYLT